MKRIGLLSITFLVSLAPVSLQSQSAPRQDSSIAIIDSMRPKIIPRHISTSRAQTRNCHGLSQRKCSLMGALMIGSIGYLAGDVSSPSPEYEERGDATLGNRQVCVAHCGIRARAIVFSLTGASIGGIVGWFTATSDRYR